MTFGITISFFGGFSRPIGSWVLVVGLYSTLSIGFGRRGVLAIGLDVGVTQWLQVFRLAASMVCVEVRCMVWLMVTFTVYCAQIEG